MSQQELLRKVIQVLEDAGIDYMVTGSIASSLQREPRLSHDIDLVADIPKSAFVDALGVYEVQFEKLDRDYMERWVKALETGYLWKRLRTEAEIV